MDLISRAEAIEALKRLRYHRQLDSDRYVITDCEDAILALPSAQPDTDEWCHDCKEYDHERHCCPRWNRVIRETLKDARPCDTCRYSCLKGDEEPCDGCHGDHYKPMVSDCDGTLTVTVPKGTKVTRVLVEEEGTQFGGLFYHEGGDK